MMKFLPNPSSHGTARTALLSFPRPNLELQTPSVLLQTRRGSPIHLTPDVLETLQSVYASALQICALHFVEGPSCEQVSASSNDVHSFVGLPSYGSFATSRDSLLFKGRTTVSSTLGVSFDTPAGVRKVTCEQYMNIINSIKPDFYSVLPDEMYTGASSKRNKTSVTRTLDWLDQCLALRKPDTQNVLGVVVGCTPESRAYSAEMTSKREVFGFQLAGFGFGESPELRLKLLKAAVGALPSEKVRHISGLGLPGDVLDAVEQGIDLFDSTYPHDLTVSGVAIVFPLRRSDEVTAGSHGSPTQLDLKLTDFRLSKEPILKGCLCYSCSRHSRAYIHHLLNAREMLADVLLCIHNTYHYLAFFQAIREAIDAGQFGEYKEWFKSANGKECPAYE